MRLLLVPMVLALCAPLAAQRGYAAAIATESNNQHKLVVHRGRLYVTYSKLTEGVPQIYVDVSSDGRTWRTLGQISRGDAPSVLSTLVLDPAGRVHVAWTRFDAGTGRVYYSRYDGRWSAPMPLSSSTAYAGYPSLDSDSRGLLHLVWYGIREGSEGQPTSHGGIYEIYHLTYDGEWSRPERISGGFPDAVNAALAIDAQDRPHVAWFQSNGQAYQVTYTRWTGGWMAPAALTSGPNPSTKPALAVDATGRVHIVWEQLAGGRSTIYYMAGTARKWSSPFPISEQDGRHPTIGLWTRGVFVLWRGEDGLISLRVSDGRWRPVQRLGSGDYPNATPWKPSPDFSPFAVWTADSGIRIMSLESILAKR